MVRTSKSFQLRLKAVASRTYDLPLLPGKMMKHQLQGLRSTRIMGVFGTRLTEVIVIRGTGVMYAELGS